MRTGGEGGSRPLRTHCVHGEGGGQKLAKLCVRTLWMAPKEKRQNKEFPDFFITRKSRKKGGLGDAGISIQHSLT